MRYSQRITFVKEKDAEYDPETGEYTEPIIEKTELPCHLSGLSIERSKELFGELDTNVIVARLQQPYGDDFDYVIIDDKDRESTRLNSSHVAISYAVFCLK